MKKNSKKYQQLISSKEKNAQFEKASAAMKRVMIAKDVIEHVKVKNIKANRGAYFEGGEYPEIGETTKAKVSLQEVMPKMELCSVCALGGMFYSSIAINNKFKADVIDKREGEIDTEFDGDDVRKKLGKFFSKYQMALIESAFEGTDYSYENDIEDMSDARELEFEKATDFCRKNNGERIDSKKAIIKIMNNIIENEGKFKP
jgi:hypothetical protein